VTAGASILNPDDEQRLAELRASLLRRKRPTLAPHQGDEAFDQHMLLAAAVHRASRLYQTNSDNETEAWTRYVVDFFPEGRNGASDARVLFDGWRCSLLKDERPLVSITHGQPEAHWLRDPAGRPCLNLEDAWDDYEHSVERFIARLLSDAEKRTTVLRRFRQRGWTVKRVVLDEPLSPVAASYATSATAISVSSG
jgi:hypothetical protein